jgi:hypothetical protein
MQMSRLRPKKLDYGRLKTTVFTYSLSMLLGTSIVIGIFAGAHGSVWGLVGFLGVVISVIVIENAEFVEDDRDG